MGASSMIVLIIAALAFSSIAILVAKLVTRGTKNSQKGEPYECGIPTTGKTWIQLNVGYYLFALIFLIFDVETGISLSMGSSSKECRLAGIG
jgi:NADH-quinone oxidoreductase subunit A